MILGLDVVGTQEFATGVNSTPVEPGVWVVACPTISEWTDEPRADTATDECNV